MLTISTVLASCRGGNDHRSFFGLDVPRNDVTQADRVAAILNGRPSVLSTFVKLDTTTLPTTLERFRMAGFTPMITLEPWSLFSKSGDINEPQYSLRSIIDGLHDRQLLTLAQQMSAYPGQIYLRFAHEMNAWWYPWAASVNGNSPTQYVEAWRHVHRLFATIPNLHLLWVWSPQAVNIQRPGAPSLGELYPGDAYVDYVGLTGYEHGAASPEDTFGRTVSALGKLTRKHVILSEIGVEGSAQAAWIAELASFLHARPSIAGFVYYNTSPATTGATGDYQVDDNPAAVDAFRAMLTSLGIPSYPARTSVDPEEKGQRAPGGRPSAR